MALTVLLETCANSLLRQNARKPSAPQTKLYSMIFFVELNQLPVWKYTGRFWSHFISNRNEAISSKNFDDSWINHIDESKQIARITSYVLLLCTKLLINLKPSTDSRKGNWKFNTFSQQPSLNFLLDNSKLPAYLSSQMIIMQVECCTCVISYL